jgi:hypothetical protein
MGFKMSCQVGLAIGESFAELRAFAAPGQPAAHQTRWYLSRKTLGEGIREALKEIREKLGTGSETGLLSVSSAAVDRALDRKQGQTPALIVTSGFETWTKAQTEMTSPVFSLRPGRQPHLAHNDFIFGISGRLAANGTEISPLNTDELSFMKSKLEMLKVKHLAVGLLHSKTSPDHEKQVVKWFAENGLRAFASSDFEHETESARWNAAVEAAYAESALEDEKSSIETAFREGLGDQASGWKMIHWSANGENAWEEFSAASTRNGLACALTRSASIRNRSSTVLHLGLDRFYLIRPDQQAMALSLRPTQLIEVGAWSFPSLSESSAGYEPGPMLFGKSQQLSVLDLLYVRDRLKAASPFEALINERSRSRILESLLILGNAAGLGKGPSPLDARQVAEDIENVVIEKIATDLLEINGQVVLQGALASSLAPLLKRRRPDLNFDVSESAEWSEADACIEALQ